MKKTLAILLALTLALSMTALAEPAEETTAIVDIVAQMDGALLCPLIYGASVSSKLSETYGFSDSVDGVSALDVLLYAHEQVFGEGFTAETVGEFLVVSDYGYTSRIFGVDTYNSGFMVNEAYPNDGTASGYGGYNGTTLLTTAVDDGSKVDFYIYQDTTYYGDLYSWLEGPANATAGETLDYSIYGAMAMGAYLYADAEGFRATAELVEGASLAWIDEYGSLEVIDTQMNDDGTYTVTMPSEAGTYYLTATGIDDYESPILINPIVVIVDAGEEADTDADSDADADADADADSDADAVGISFVNITDGYVTGAEITGTDFSGKLYVAVYEDGALCAVESASVSAAGTVEFSGNTAFDYDTQVLKCFIWGDSLMPLTTALTVGASLEPDIITGFVFTGGTAAADVEGGDKTSGYPNTEGAVSAVLKASVDGENGRKLEWTADPYTYPDNVSEVTAAMTAGKKNPWGDAPYFDVEVSTAGYENITFSACLGATKKGPANYKLRYSTDGENYSDIDGATYSLSANKTLELAFDMVALPEAADDCETLHIRIALADLYAINGNLLSDEPTGGEAAINWVYVSGNAID